MVRQIPIYYADEAENGDSAPAEEPKKKRPAGKTAQPRPEEPAAAAVQPETPPPASPASAEEESWRERYLRLQADFENYRRHAEADKARLVGLGKEEALADIFPLVDHLDRGLAWAREHAADQAVVEGLLLVQKELSKTLEKHGIARLAVLGERFNPALHEAVSCLPREGIEEGVILEEVAAGFTRDGKLLRPAKVVVAA